MSTVHRNRKCQLFTGTGNLSCSQEQEVSTVHRNRKSQLFTGTGSTNCSQEQEVSTVHRIWKCQLFHRNRKCQLFTRTGSTPVHRNWKYPCSQELEVSLFTGTRSVFCSQEEEITRTSWEKLSNNY